MEVLEEAMKKNNIHLNTFSAWSSGQTHYASTYASLGSGYALNVSSSSHEWQIDSGDFYRMGKDKAMF